VGLPIAAGAALGAAGTALGGPAGGVAGEIVGSQLGKMASDKLAGSGLSDIVRHRGVNTGIITRPISDIITGQVAKGGGLKKGSPEMKEKMSKLRAMRKKKIEGEGVWDDIKHFAGKAVRAGKKIAKHVARKAKPLVAEAIKNSEPLLKEAAKYALASRGIHNNALVEGLTSAATHGASAVLNDDHEGVKTALKAAKKHAIRHAVDHAVAKGKASAFDLIEKSGASHDIKGHLHDKIHKGLNALQEKHGTKPVTELFEQAPPPESLPEAHAEATPLVVGGALRRATRKGKRNPLKSAGDRDLGVDLHPAALLEAKDAPFRSSMLSTQSPAWNPPPTINQTEKPNNIAAPTVLDKMRGRGRRGGAISGCGLSLNPALKSTCPSESNRGGWGNGSQETPPGLHGTVGRHLPSTRVTASRHE